MSKLDKNRICSILSEILSDRYKVRIEVKNG